MCDIDMKGVDSIGRITTKGAKSAKKEIGISLAKALRRKGFKK